MNIQPARDFSSKCVKNINITLDFLIMCDSKRLLVERDYPVIDETTTITSDNCSHNTSNLVGTGNIVAFLWIVSP